MKIYPLEYHEAHMLHHGLRPFAFHNRARREGSFVVAKVDVVPNQAEELPSASASSKRLVVIYDTYLRFQILGSSSRH